MKTFHFPVTGHDLLAVERFRDDTRHMVEFLVLTEGSPWGTPEQYVRRFLSEDAYRTALQAHQEGSIRIYKHAIIIEGHILPDKARKRRRAST